MIDHRRRGDDSAVLVERYQARRVMIGRDDFFAPAVQCRQCEFAIAGAQVGLAGAADLGINAGASQPGSHDRRAYCARTGAGAEDTQHGATYQSQQ